MHTKYIKDNLYKKFIADISYSKCVKDRLYIKYYMQRQTSRKSQSDAIGSKIEEKNSIKSKQKRFKIYKN